MALSLSAALIKASTQTYAPKQACPNVGSDGINRVVSMRRSIAYVSGSADNNRYEASISENRTNQMR